MLICRTVAFFSTRTSLHTL